MNPSTQAGERPVNTVADVMTREPVSVTPADTVQHAARLMDELNVGALPVCDGGSLVGIVTDRDITVRATAAGLAPASTAVALVMTERVRSCGADQRLADALDLMASVQIRRLPVLDTAQRLLGMLALGDIAERRHEGVQDALCRISTPSQPDRGLAAGA
jgi:CBS domain-containing protein